MAEWGKPAEDYLYDISRTLDSILETLKAMLNEMEKLASREDEMPGS